MRSLTLLLRHVSAGRTKLWKALPASMSATTTLQPSRAKTRAVSAPIPCAAPVMMATWPATISECFNTVPTTHRPACPGESSALLYQPFSNGQMGSQKLLAHRQPGFAVMFDPKTRVRLCRWISGDGARRECRIRIVASGGPLSLLVQSLYRRSFLYSRG